MKVLALIPDFLEKPSGGVGEQMRHIHNKLQDKVQYYICGYPEKNNIPNYRSVLAPIPSFPHVALTTIYGQSIYFLEGLNFKEDFDIIHACDWSTFYAGVLASWHFKKPLVCTMQLSLQQLNQNGIFYCENPSTVDGAHINGLQIMFEQMGLFYANKIIQVSKYYADQYKEYQDKSVVIHNGIDFKKWVKQNKSPFIKGSNKTKICYIGRASAMKGIETILLSNIPDNIDFYFVVSDKNAEEPIFSNIKNKCNNKNIFHIQGLYDQDKIDFLFEMDAVVMPSTHEPFGIVALEALASECLLVTTASGGIKEIVEDIEYFHIENSEDLNLTYDKISNLSESNKKAIIEKGRNHVKNFDWEVQSEKVYQVYKEVSTMKYNENIVKL